MGLNPLESPTPKFCSICSEEIPDIWSPLHQRFERSKRTRCWSCSQMIAKQNVKRRLEHRNTIPPFALL